LKKALKKALQKLWLKMAKIDLLLKIVLERIHPNVGAKKTFSGKNLNKSTFFGKNST
jgi:hypothetical protein